MRKLNHFESFLSTKKYRFQISLSYRGPYLGLLDDISKVAYGNNASFAGFQMTLCLALPSWFHKLCNKCEIGHFVAATFQHFSFPFFLCPVLFFIFVGFLFKIVFFDL